MIKLYELQFATCKMKEASVFLGYMYFLGRIYSNPNFFILNLFNTEFI